MHYLVSFNKYSQTNQTITTLPKFTQLNLSKHKFENPEFSETLFKIILKLYCNILANLAFEIEFLVCHYLFHQK
jgi:hypothetical protein